MFDLPLTLLFLGNGRSKNPKRFRNEPGIPAVEISPVTDVYQGLGFKRGGLVLSDIAPL